ncbi:MAG: permease [Spirochaetales bacterium]|nr:permease [Spirochaetales bacterium]
MKTVKKYLMTLIALLGLAVLFFLRRETAEEAVNITISGIGSMIMILPPILLMMNLLDVLVPKEIVIKHMGEDAGLKGYFWALILGTFAAGPLYAAFPIAALLAKKNARMAYIIFFLGMWTVSKLPLLTYELNFFGLSFTGLHILTGMVGFFLLSLVLEKIFLKKEKTEIYERLSRI